MRENRSREAGEALEQNEQINLDADTFGAVLGKLDLNRPPRNPASSPDTGTTPGQAEAEAGKDEGAEKTEDEDPASTPDAETTLEQEDEDGDPASTPDTETTPGQEDEDAESEGEDAGEGEDHLLKKAKLSAEQQAAVNKRIGKEVGKRKALEEQLEAANERIGRMDEELGKLRDASKGVTAATAAAQGVDPLFLASDEGELEERSGKVNDFIEYLEDHQESGIEPSEDGKVKGMTPDEVRAKLRTYRRERDMVIPKAREILHKRREIDQAVTRVVYPDLFDRKSAAYQEREAILRKWPALGAFPEANVVIGDMLVGRVYRAQLAKQKKAGEPAARKPAPKPAPRVPTSPAGGGAQTPKTKTGEGKGKELSAAAVVAAGGDRDALVGHIRGLL